MVGKVARMDEGSLQRACLQGLQSVLSRDFDQEVRITVDGSEGPRQEPQSERCI